MGIQIQLERFDVQVLGRSFQYEGQMAPVGRVLDFFNSEGRSTFPLFDVKICPVEPDSRLSGITRSEIIVSEREMGLVFFCDPEYRQRVQLLRNCDRVIAYTPYAVLRGNFHRGVETRLRDLFDMMQGAFLAMTDVSIFPTSTLPSVFPQQADVLILNRHYVDLYHPE